MEAIIGPWFWYAIALILIVFEGMRPSGLFASMAVAAAILGGLITAYPELSWQQQLAIYATMTAVLAFIVMKIVATIRKNDEDLPESKSMIGEEFTLKQSIQNGFGEIELEDHFWSLKGADMKKGTEVRVIGIDGNMLVVVPTSILPKNKTDDSQEKVANPEI